VIANVAAREWEHLGDGRSARSASLPAREPIGSHGDPLKNAELLELLMRGDPADLERVAQLFGQIGPTRSPRVAHTIEPKPKTSAPP